MAHFFVWLLIFVVPWESLVIIPGIGTVSRVVGVGALAAIGLNVLLRGRLRPLGAFQWLVLVYLCWFLLSVFWAVSKPLLVEARVYTQLQSVVMMWLIWETTPTRARLVSLMQAYVLGAYITAGSTILNYATGAGYRGTARFAASGVDPNDVGSLLALALPMAWYISSTTSSGFQRWVNRVFFPVGTVGILLTGSRGALLATLVALFVIPWTLTRLRRGVRVAAVAIMLGAGLAAVRFVPTKSFERLSTTTSEISEGTLNNRLKIWKAGIATVPERPIHGFGPGGFVPAVAPRLGHGEAPHNTFLSVLLEEGIIGLALYLAMLLVLVNRLLRLPTFERRVALTLLGTLLTVMMPLGWDTHKESWLMLALLAGCADVLAPGRPATAPARPVPSALRRPARGVTRVPAG